MTLNKTGHYQYLYSHKKKVILIQTLWNVKAYTSWSNTCFVVGAGWSSNYASAGYSVTYYAFASTVLAGIGNLYNSVVNKAKTLKK